MKSLLIIVLLNLMLLCGSVSHMKLHSGGRKGKSVCQAKEVDCGDVVQVLTHISDMISQETVSKTEFTFRQRVHFMEQIIVELTHLSEYYELRQLQQNYELNIGRDHLYFWNVFIKTMHKQYDLRTQELISTYFITSVIFAMRLQVYTSIRMVSIIHNLEYTLMSNNFAYDVHTVSRSFFQLTVDYFRLVQVDRLLAKGVLFQISEQIAHAQFNLQFQKGLTKQEQENGLQVLNKMWADYEGQVLTETATYDQQFAQLVLLQKIQYQYEQYSKDTSKLLSKHAMKAIAGHLADLSFRDSKVFVDYVESRKQARMMQASVYQEWHQQAYKSRTFSVLDPANTFQDLPALENFASALLADSVKTFPFHDSKYFRQNELSDVKNRHNLHLFTKEQVEKMHSANPFVKDYIGLDNGAVQNVRMALDTVYHLLQACQERQVFPDQIGLLHDFSPEADTTENIYSSVMASFVSLKEGYDNYVNWAYQFYQVHQQMQEEVERTFEFQELKNLLDKRIVPMQDKLNKRLKLHQAQLFNDFLALLVEVRNYNKLQQQAVKQMPETFVSLSPAQQNKVLLEYLNKHYQADFLKFYDRFQYKLNSFFLTQSNVIASVKAFSSLLSDQLIKIYFVLEKKISPYFLSPLEKQNLQKKENRLKKKYLKRLSKRVQSMQFLQVNQARRRLHEDKKQVGQQDESTQEEPSKNAMLPDYRVDLIHTRDKLTIYYLKIEGSAFYKQQVLFTRVRLYNNLLMKFMMKKYTATAQAQQKLVGSPFEDYQKNFLDGVVTRSALFRVDGLLTGANTVEAEQYGERKALLQLMDRHKCALIRIYRSFQMSLKEYYIQARITIDLNYQEFILRVRQAFYLYVSDLEVVVVDESDNYYNTINQLKIMGYDEITFPQYQGKNPLLLQLVQYKQQMSGMSESQTVRVFYCQGCFNRILRSVEVFSYSEYSQDSLVAYMKSVITRKTQETGLHYYYEMTMVVFEESSMTQSVYYVVKVFERVSAFHLMISSTTHRSGYYSETTTTTTDISTTRTDSTRTIQTVIINGHCVLDSFSTSKSFSIYDQVITRSEHVSEMYNVQTVVTSVDIDSVEFKNMRTAVHSFFYDTTIQSISEEYKRFLSVYDESAFHFSEKIIRQENTVELDFNSYFRYYVYVPRKLIYSDYLLLLQFEWFVHEQLLTDKVGAVVSISSYVTVIDMACSCRQYEKPDCFFEKGKLSAMRAFPMENTATKKVTSKGFNSFNRKLFGSSEWKVGKTSSWGRLFSKVTNLVLDMTRDSYEVTGSVLATKKISTWNDYLELLSMEEAVKQSSLDQGLNLLPVSVYSPLSDASQHLEVTLLKVTDQHLRFHALEFPLYEDDLRFSVVVNQMKLAFMFPSKMVPENILDNGIQFRQQPPPEKKSALQEAMNTIYSDNDMYTIYVGRMDEVIDNRQYLRVFVDGSAECVGHRAQVISAEQAQFYSDVIDPEYVVTEVFYYFEQERQEQYVQDLLAINYNDPFYKTLYALGFRPVTSSDGDSYSIYGFYDFTVTYNEDVQDKCEGQNGGEGSGQQWMYKRPARGMKRIWVRPMQYCQDSPSTSDLYCNPKSSKVQEEDKEKSVLQRAHAAFSVQYSTLTEVYRQNQNTNPRFSHKTYTNEISTVTKILKETGGKGKDARAYTLTDDDLQPEREDIGGVSANNDFVVSVQPFYRFLDSGMTGHYDYFADRKMLNYPTHDGVHDLSHSLSSERSHIYRFHAYSDKTDTAQQKYSVSNYNAFSYLSARDEKALKCYSNQQPDVPNDIYVREITMMHQRAIQKEISVLGDCYNPAYSYIAHSYEKVIVSLLQFNANVCLDTPKRLRKLHKKKKHRKRRLHKRKHHL